MSNGVSAVSYQARQSQAVKATPSAATPSQGPAAASKAQPATAPAQRDKVALSGEVKKDSRGIPLPKAQSVEVQPWGKGNNDKACLEGILRSGGYSEKEIYAKGPDGKSLLSKIAAQNGLKDPNLVHAGKSISFVPKEEQDVYEARQTTVRRDDSLKKLAQGPVKTEHGVVAPKDGFKAIADASLERMNTAYKNLPEAGRKGVEEQLTVVASDWSKGPGNRARFERAGADEKQGMQRTWLAQAAGNYARSAGAEGKKSDLINLGQGARQYLEAQIGLQEKPPLAKAACQVQPGPAKPAAAEGPKAPLPAFINAWGQGLRDAGQSVSDLGRWAQNGVGRGVDSATKFIDGNLHKEMKWASAHSPSASADIWALGAVGSAAHFVGGAVKGAARLGTGALEGAGALMGGAGTAQQWAVNDRVHAEVNGKVSQFVQDPAAPFVRLGEQAQASWNKDQAGFLGEFAGFAAATFYTGGLAGSGRGAVAAADDVINVTATTVPGSTVIVRTGYPGAVPAGLLSAAL